MDSIGGRKFLDIPGDRTYDLPPLLVYRPPTRHNKYLLDMAMQVIVDDDIVIADDDIRIVSGPADSRKMDLAIILVDNYLVMRTMWHYGNSVLGWVEQCETTFGERVDLRPFLHTDIWPHGGRASFVRLIEDKGVMAGVDVEKAVGIRVSFRKLPPVGYFTNQSLLYLNKDIARGGYRGWADKAPPPVYDFPPERFAFQVIETSDLAATEM